ncbi:perosamine synthetase [Anaerovirgula multivorans]|uniref:Perosamine synthetase n=1 Tax=Anaerovirgula multivorans TaxID=312168 RepID=A0A239DMP9_9FIRM|nr:LegC family aminotransferase [Anaerovirgula multivorans]SNS32983.1 perosamine synthetase [Anaerovirgula multivorans]
MEKLIPLSVPNFTGKELEYVKKAVESEWVSTEGPFVKEFEEKIAKYLKIKKAVACQNGTAALHLALRLSGVELGDEVIVPTLTFIATVNPVKYQGAEPVFMDCDDTLNMDLDKLESFCESQCTLTENGLMNKRSNRIIKALIIVHVFGNMSNMERVMNIAEKYRLKVIEDATEALGSYYRKRKYSGKFAGTIGDFGAYSFNANKIITSGGGGVLVAKDASLSEKAKYLSNQAKDNPIYYVHETIGYNYRMTNLQAALGVAQLEELEEFIQIKIKNYNLYKKEVKEIEGLSLLEFNSDIRPNCWFYPLIVDKEKYRLGRDNLMVKLSERGIQTRPIWSLIHEQKPYMHNQSYKIDKAKYWIKRVLNIPCSTNLEINDVLRVIRALNSLKSQKEG